MKKKRNKEEKNLRKAILSGVVIYTILMVSLIVPQIMGNYVISMLFIPAVLIYVFLKGVKAGKKKRVAIMSFITICIICISIYTASFSKDQQEKICYIISIGYLIALFVFLLWNLIRKK